MTKEKLRTYTVKELIAMDKAGEFDEKKPTSLKDSIIELIRGDDSTSFGEINNHLGGGGRLKGKSMMGVGPSNSNVYIWIEMSKEYFKAMSELINEGKVVAQPASPLIYLHDGGGMPRLPIAKRAHPYKEPHWLPVTLRLADSSKNKTK